MFSGPWEIILVFLVILLLFGAKRLPSLARSIGKSLSEFKRGKDEGARSTSIKEHLDPEDESDEKS